MQYKEVLLNDGTPLYTSINQYISANDYEHVIELDTTTGIEKSRQTNVRVLGIPESYNTNTERILTNKGYLFVKISDNVYHEYHIFKEPIAEKFGNVLIINEPLDFNNATYENTHRLVLYRESYVDVNAGGATKYRYYTDAIKYGFNGEVDKAGNKIYLYRLDVDGYIKPNADDITTIYYPEDDGYYHVSHSATGIRYFLFSYKQYMYIHLNPANKVSMKLVNINGDEITSKLYKFDNDNYYIDVETSSGGETVLDPDEGLDISPKTGFARDDNNYMYITFIADDDTAPEQLMVEVN